MPNEIKALYHITPRDNVPSILKHGILSHAALNALAKQSNGGILSRVRSWFPGGAEGAVAPQTIYDSEVVELRKERMTPDGKSLWDYSNFYINPRNAMLFRAHRHGGKHVVVLVLSPEIMNAPGSFLSVKNAAVSEAKIVPVSEGLPLITPDKTWDKIHAEWWNTDSEIMRLGMSEVLVPDRVEAKHITAIYVPTGEDRDIIRKIPNRPPVSVEHHMFFNPKSLSYITENIRLVDGDMFLSRRQTLTISVNTVGVMGKGQAARMKEQFRTAYVAYRKACHEKKIALGAPFVYNRSSTDYVWGGAPTDETTDTGAGRKLLFFPTKGHWREQSQIKSIVSGLKWLIDNWEQEGITSIALPALGCGEGGLPWKQVGPLMCRALSRIPIVSEIYLPRESDVPAEHKTRHFLLKTG